MSLNRQGKDFVEYHYYRINYMLLSILNFWPYRQSKFSTIIHTFHFGILISFISFQFTSFCTSQLTMDFVVMVLSYAIPSFLYMIQYYSFYSRPNQIKQIWKDICDSWNLLKNEAERDIMRQHSSTGELGTIIILFAIVTGVILYMLVELWPTILDIIFPLNETRLRDLHALTEYFVDEETYFYPILCHWLFGVTFGAFVVIVTTTLEMVYVEHICGLLKIASYRIEHSIDEYTLHNPIRKKINCTVLQNITDAVYIHRKALERCQFLLDNFSSTFFVLIVIIVTSLSLNLFRLLRAILLQDMFEIIASVIFIGMHFFFLFTSNYYGQKITDHNNEIFQNTYNISWYVAPVEIQKLLLFIIQYTTKSYILNIGYLILASVEGFSKLASTSISYFTVIYLLLFSPQSPYRNAIPSIILERGEVAFDCRRAHILFDFHGKMIAIESWYYKINRILLLICGLWPYDNTKFRHIRIVIIFGLSVSFVIYQLTVLTHKCNFRIVMNVLAEVFGVTLCILQYIGYLLNSRKTNLLLNQICEDWNVLKDSKEVEIAKKYGKSMRLFTIILLMYTVLSWIILALVLLIPNIFNNFSTSSEFLKQDDVSRKQIDKDIYFLIYYLTVIFVDLFVLTSSTTMVLAYLQHICMMLTITCYRIEHSLDENGLHMSIFRKERLMYQKLISAVNIHRRAIKFSEYFLSSFKQSYFFLIGISVLSLAINLLLTLQALLIQNMSELILSIFYIVPHFIYSFVNHYGGQMVTDHSANILTALYNIKWYTAPIRVQKLILFLMLKNTKNFGFVIGGIYVASMENYLTFTSTSLSYFMVIYSTQQ
ncbi:uncharacterized protein [Linepithema humile]|uniref:uncharacterized protein n=1 Tax=Linepithema humile TaxID=83485 RepID=UPI00351E457D